MHITRSPGETARGGVVLVVGGHLIEAFDLDHAAADRVDSRVEDTGPVQLLSVELACLRGFMAS